MYPCQSGVPESRFDNHLDLFQVLLGSTPRLRLNAVGLPDASLNSSFVIWYF